MSAFQVHQLQLVKDTYVWLIAATRHTRHCARNNAIASLYVRLIITYLLTRL